MSKQFVDDPLTRNFWFFMGLFSVFTLTIAGGNLVKTAEDSDKMIAYIEVYEIAIIFIVCYVMLMVWSLLRTPPAGTHEMGRDMRAAFQIAVIYGMFFLAYKYPKPEVVAVSFALLAGGIAGVQLVYPAHDFHVGFALMTVFAGFIMGCCGVSIDPIRGENVYFVIPWSGPYVVMVFLTNFPTECCNLGRSVASS